MKLFRAWSTTFLLLTLMAANAIASSQPSCVSPVVDLLGIDMSMQSDPTLMQEIINTEYYLSEFSHTKTLFSEELTAPLDLSLFLARIKHGIEVRHPAVNDFLCAALSEKLIAEDAYLDPVINRTIHRMVVLEKLTQKMVSDLAFMKELRDYYLSIREPYLEQAEISELIPEKLRNILILIDATGGVFEAAKLFTMDRVFNQYVGYREKVYLDDGDLTSKRLGLFTNIIEATATDIKAGFTDNAIAGVALELNPIQKIEVTDDNLMVRQYFVDGWASLYETWNLAFVVGNLDDLHIILPKLLIPSVIDAEDDEYLFNRGLSLWVTINAALHHNFNNKPTKVLPNKDLMAEKWGEINRSYARELMQR